MMKIKLALFFLLWSCTTKNDTSIKKSTQFIDSKKYSITENLFTIDLDIPYEKTTSTIPTDLADISCTTYMGKKGVNLIYLVSITTYPSSLYPKNPSNFLNDILLIQESYQEASIEKNNLEENSNRTSLYFKFSNGDLFIEGKYYWIEPYFIETSITREGAYHDEKETSTFLSSIKWL